jgi:hypothetical protein
MKRQYIALLILLPFLVVGGLQLWRATQPAPALILEEAAKRSIISLPERKIAKRFRHVKLHPDALQDVREGGRIWNCFPARRFGFAWRILNTPAETARK